MKDEFYILIHNVSQCSTLVSVKGVEILGYHGTSGIRNLM